MCENIQNCCRICLDADSDRVPIIGDPTICLHMKSCLTIAVSTLDHLPKEICVSCVSQLNQFYNFQINARCSQDWLESSLQEMLKKPSETKTPIQPLPDSEYNSDSLLEFLNNTANIEEYLNNLGKEDIPSIVSMLDRNEQATEIAKVSCLKTVKIPSPKKKDKIKTCKKMKIEIDVLDSDVEIVKGLIKKGTDTKVKPIFTKVDTSFHTCFACKTKFDNVQKLSQHLSICDNAVRTCVQCHTLFDSKQKLNQHMLTHNTLSCNCGEQFLSKASLIQHRKTCQSDMLAGFIYRCKECGDTFKDRFQLYRHAKEHLLKEKLRTCDICGHSFKNEEALVKHREEEHEKTVNSLYRCKVCSHTSTDHKEMFIHVKRHTERPEPRRHLCESCGRSFATRASLIRHAQQHDQNKIKCRICNTHFSSEKDLEAHLLEHVEMVMCERCGLTVINYKLSEHCC